MAEEGGLKKGAPLELAPELVMGMDVQRFWASGVQVTSTPEVTFLVFREQNSLQVGEEGEPHLMVRNVVSVVMPTPVARQMTSILQAQLGDESGDEPPSAA